MKKTLLICICGALTVSATILTGCKKLTTTPTATISGKWALYRQIDTVYLNGKPSDYTVQSLSADSTYYLTGKNQVNSYPKYPLVDTLNFTSSTAGTETGGIKGSYYTILFTYNISSHTFSDADVQSNGISAQIVQLNTITIKLVESGGAGTDVTCSLYKKL